MEIRTSDKAGMQGRLGLRRTFLGGASSALLATLAVNPALAGEASVIGGVTTVNGVLDTSGVQINEGSVTAIANDSTFGIETVTQSGATNILSANTIGAIAAANRITQSGDLGLLAPAGDMVSAVFQTNAGPVTGTADTNVILNAMIGLPAVAEENDNRIFARAGVNDSVTTIEGNVPGDFGSTTAGDTLVIDTGSAGDGNYSADGSIAALTVQGNGSSPSSATVTSNLIRVDVDTAGTDPATQSVSGAITADRNATEAEFQGNNAATSILIEGGDSPLFNGSASIASYQYHGTSGLDSGQEAANINSQIGGSVAGSLAPAAAPLTGSLSVSDNEIKAAAVANNAVRADGGAGNRIVLDGGMSVAGSTPAGDSGAFVVPGAVIIGADADLAITGVQRNIDASWLGSSVSEALISGSVESSLGGSMTVSRNLIESVATGNHASSLIASGGGAASLEGTAAVVNYQSNVNGGTTSNISDSDIVATLSHSFATNQEEARVAANANAMRAIARGNHSGQRVGLDGVAVDIGSGSAAFSLTAPLPIVADTEGGATITNIQINDVAPIEARLVDSEIRIDADTGNNRALLDSSFEAVGNLQEAVAVGAHAENDLRLSGNQIGSGAGVNSLQFNDEAGILTTFSGTMAINAGFNMVSTALNLSENRQNATGVGNSADNHVSIDATTVLIDPASIGDLAVSMDDGGLESRGAYVVQNGQMQLADVEVDLGDGGADESYLHIAVDNRLRLGSSARIDDNIIRSNGFGNDASNGIALDVNDLSVGGGHANVAIVANGQWLDGNVSADMETGGPGISILVDGYVEQTATLSASGNEMSARAFGNRTILPADENGSLQPNLQVTGNNILAAAGVGDRRGAIFSGATIDSDAAFVVQNGQVADGSVEALVHRDANGQPDILMSLRRDMTDAAVVADGNIFSAATAANDGASALVLEANSLRTTAAVQNYQEANEHVRAINGSEDSGILVESGRVAGAVMNLVSASSVSISDNVRSTSTAANQAMSSLDASAGTITAGGNNASAFADDESAFGDYVLGNSQDANVGSADDDVLVVTATSIGSLEYDNLDETNVDLSSVALVDNVQSAEGMANKGSNSLSLRGTAMVLNAGGFAVNSALMSVQRAENIEVNIDSALTLAAPAEIANSSLDINGNRNLARGVTNYVENELSISATDLDGDAAGTADLLGGSDQSTATADHVLNNVQMAHADLTSNAATNIGDNDAGDAGAVNGSLTISRNVTTAEANANRAINSVSVAGLASNGASAVLANYQDSDITVTANATTDAGFAMAGGVVDAVADSAIALNDNVTNAQAAGNIAANALNHAAGTLSAAPASASLVHDGADLTASAPALVLNGQSNSRSITASATMTHNAVLNGIGGMAANRASISVAGNSAEAVSLGNHAVNSVSITGVNAAAGAVANAQNNFGAVSAAASGSSITIRAPAGGVANASLGVTGNMAGATAVGNSASNIIGR